MKKYLSIIAIASLGLIAACKKNSTEPTIVINSIPVNLEQTLNNKQVYTLDLTQYGDKDDISSIIQQATHYTTSQIDVTTADKRGSYTYMYDAANLTAGKIIIPTVLDSVILKIVEAPNERWLWWQQRWWPWWWWKT
jgi:hypothetical protein